LFEVYLEHICTRSENVGENRNQFFENLVELKSLATAVTNQNDVYEVKNRLFLGNICCHSVLNVLPSRLLSTNLNANTNRTTLPYVLCGCET